MSEMMMRSPAFEDHALIPNRYAHSHGDVSPPLEWIGVPDDAAELALACKDPDAPNGTFVHWLLAGIPPQQRGLEAGAAPGLAVPGRNGFGATGYGGPYPPPGDDPHHYVFRLYALPEPSRLPHGFTAQEFARFEREALETATVVGTYGR